MSTHHVKLSAVGASNHSNSSIAREHWEIEQALQQSTMTWTILRPHGFMQNWLGELAQSVRAEGVIYSPIGDGRVPFTDTRDIAAVAAEAQALRRVQLDELVEGSLDPLPPARIPTWLG